MSPMRCSEMRPARRNCSNSDGDVGGGSDNPTTRAPSIKSHSESHEPLNPVWPVTSTVFPAKTPCNNSRLDGGGALVWFFMFAIHQIFQGAFFSSHRRFSKRYS